MERGIRKVGSVTGALAEGKTTLELIRDVLEEFELEVLETTSVEYRCYCSRDRVTRALISMGCEEMKSLIGEQGCADLTCQFCDRIYHYDRAELEEILKNM